MNHCQITRFINQYFEFLNSQNFSGLKRVFQTPARVQCGRKIFLIQTVQDLEEYLISHFRFGQIFDASYIEVEEIKILKENAVSCIVELSCVVCGFEHQRVIDFESILILNRVGADFKIAFTADRFPMPQRAKAESR